MINTANILWWLTTLACISSNTAQNKTKRQIYREQVLPHSGGKIPEGAFRADRLALNRLNKEGIAIPDGILLEHRSVHSHPHSVKHDPEDEDSVIKIIQQTENRYAPVEGRYQNEMPLTVSSTYLIRKPIGRDEQNILTPQYQRPHHQAVGGKQNVGYHSNYQYQEQRYQPPPPPRHSYANYQQHHRQPPHIYHSIPVPFELPNKEVQQEDYYLKQYGNSYPSQENYRSGENYANSGGHSDVNYSPNYSFGEGPPAANYISNEDYSTAHYSSGGGYPNTGGQIDWEDWLGSIERLPDIKQIIPQSGFGYDPRSLQYYDNPGSHLQQLDGFSHFFGDRFVRKSAEGHARGKDEKKRRNHPKEPTKFSRTFYKRVAQVKCSPSERDESKCQVY